MALRRPTLGDRISYHVDNLMAWNPFAKVIALFAATLLLVAASGAISFLFAHAGAESSFGASLLKSWGQVLDPTGHTSEEALPAFAIGLLTSLGGMIVFALLIGLVSDGLSERMDDLKKGRSRVIEKGHTLILGWNDKLLPLLREIALANESAGGGVVVILSEVDKEAMETEIRESVRNLRATSVVCRTGSPWMIGDLEKVAADAARAIVVLASDPDPDESDARAIRTVLALRRALSGMRGHAVVEVNDQENLDLIAMIGGDKVEPVMTHDVVGRLIIQSARQPGLAHIYDALLGFEGSEFYLKAWPQLEGKTFGEVSRSFPGAIVCGIRNAALLLNPKDDVEIAKGDELLVIAADDDRYAPAPPVNVSAQELPKWRPPDRKPERILFCGWRRDLAAMITELDGYVGPGSELTILAQIPLEDRKAGSASDAEEGGLEHLSITHRVGNPALRRDLTELGVERFDSVLVLADETDEDEPSKADTRNLSSLLLIRDIQEKCGREPAVLISEIRDPRTKLLVATTKISDYVVSSEIMSKYIAQVAERQQIALVWGELLDSEGFEIYLKDARHYARDGEVLSFWEIAARARLRGEIALGYRPNGREHVLNPIDKNARRAVHAGDSIIVIAGNDQ